MAHFLCAQVAKIPGDNLYALISSTLDNLGNALGRDTECISQAAEALAPRIPHPDFLISLALGRRVVSERHHRQLLADVHEHHPVAHRTRSPSHPPAVVMPRPIGPSRQSIATRA